jgi:adenylate kinase
VPKGTLVRRKDDEPAAIHNRMQVYEAQTAPVIAWYRTHGAHIAEINASGQLDDVTARALKAVGKG